jgi:hypothetical protein
MATKLKTFDFTSPSKLTVSEKATYPWDEWLDGDIWELRQGEDFEGHPLMMERIIRTRATGRKAKISLRHVPINGEPWGVIVLRRNDIEGPSAAKKRATVEKRQATRASRSAEVTPAQTTKKPEVKRGPAIKKLAVKTDKKVSKRPARRLATVG